MSAEIAAASTAIEAIGREAVAAVTPVSNPSGPANPHFPMPPAPGGLQRSTMAVSTVDGTTIRTEVEQPARTPDDGSKWGGNFIAAFVLYGHGDIVPTRKKALAGAFFGPVRHVGPVAGRNYPADAATTIDEGMAAESSVIAAQVAERIREALR